jgi:hypothetical protein
MPPVSHALNARVLLCSALLVPLACGELESNDDESTTTGEPDEWNDIVDPVAGSRLRPIFRTAEDGTRTQVGWHDTLFDTPCAFSHTADGDLRCLPTNSAGEPWHYADANCTQPALQDHQIPEGATVVNARDHSCFGYSYWQVGEAVDEIYYNANGPCEVFSNDPSHRVTLIPYDQFVPATLTPQPGQSRIVPMLLEADDGAQQIFGAWDRVHEEQVTPALDDAQQLRWFGHRQPRVSTSYYADAGCTQRVAITSCMPDSDEPTLQPTTAKETAAGDCGPVLGRHELLEKVVQLYSEYDGQCEPTSIDSDVYQVWRVGAPLDDGDFAESSALDGGGERMRLDIHGGPEGEPFLASSRLRDRQLAEAECHWIDMVAYSSDPSTTATFECVPVDEARFNNRYRDSACTERIAYRLVWEESCPMEVPLYAYGDGMAAPITGPAAGEGGYGFDDMDVCVSFPPSVPPDGDGEYEYYVVEDTPIPVATAVDVIE